jgi:N-terminal C2 in EEIG1 and EHBP1 proteins
MLKKKKSSAKPKSKAKAKEPKTKETKVKKQKKTKVKKQKDESAKKKRKLKIPKKKKGSSSSSKERLKVRFKITLNGAEHLVKRARQKYVYVAWQRGTQKVENKGTTRYVQCKSGKVTWNETFEVTSTFIRDKKTNQFRTKDKRLFLTIRAADDLKAQRETQAEKRERKEREKSEKGHKDSSKEDGEKQKHVSKLESRVLRKEHDELASIYIDLLDYIRDGANVVESLQFGKKSVISLRVTTQWLKLDKKLLIRKPLEKEGDATAASSSSAAASSSSSSSTTTPTTEMATSTTMIDGVEYGLQTDPNWSGDSDATTMPDMTATMAPTEDDFSDEDDDLFGDDGGGHSSSSAAVAASSSAVRSPFLHGVNRLKREDSFGTSSEMGPRRRRGSAAVSANLSSSGSMAASSSAAAAAASSSSGAAPSLEKSHSLTDVQSASSSSYQRETGLSPEAMRVQEAESFVKPKFSKQSLLDLVDALHYCIFLPIHKHFELEHSPQDLLELVRDSLGMKQAHQDEWMDRVLPTCNYEHMLALLDVQLARLRGAPPNHRFYLPDNFATEEMHALWLRGELARVESLHRTVREQNQNALESATIGADAPYRRFADVDFHTLYRNLLKILFYYDVYVNRFLDHDAVVLSQQSAWLLKEFGERYQVGPLFRVLSLLALLVEIWSNAPVRLGLLQIAVERLQRLLTGSSFASSPPSPSPSSSSAAAPNKKAIISKAELAFMRSIFEELDTRLQQSFDEFYNLGGDFNASSPLKTLLSVLRLFIDLEARIGLRERTYGEQLRELVRRGIEEMYDKMIEATRRSAGSADDGDHAQAASSSSSSTSANDAPLSANSAVQLQHMSELIATELTNLQSYNDVFDFDIVSLASRGFGKWFFADLEAFCAADGAAGAPPVRMLHLARATRRLSATLSTRLGADQWGGPPTPLVKLFQPSVNRFFDHCVGEYRAKVATAVRKDTFDRLDGVDYGSSTLHVFAMLTSGMELVGQFEFAAAADDNSTWLREAFARDVFAPAVEHYAAQLHASFTYQLVGADKKLSARFVELLPLDALLEHADDNRALLAERMAKIKSDSSSTQPLGEALCVRLNCVGALRAKVAEFGDKVALADAFAPLAERCATMSSAAALCVALWLNVELGRLCKHFVRRSSKRGLEPVQLFLKQQIVLYLDKYLSNHLSKLVLSHVWALFVDTMRTLLAAKGKPKAKHLERGHALVADVLEFFDQGGLQRAQLSSDRANLFQSLST